MKHYKIYLIGFLLILHNVLYADELSDGYRYLNQIRTQVGMVVLNRNAQLEQAAQNHSDYLIQNNEMGHYETAGKTGFTGKAPTDRVQYAGYNGGAGENASMNEKTVNDSIDTLMSAIYHRFGFLNFRNDEIGIGFARTSSKEARYIYNFSAHDYSYKNNSNIVQWPSVDSKNISPVFYEEIPDPLPDYSISGYPISVQFNPAHFTQVTVQNFKLFNHDTNQEITNTRLFSKSTDPNGYFTDLQFALFPLERLNWASNYRVEFSYHSDKGNDNLIWTFRTKDPDGPYFLQESIKYQKQELYTKALETIEKAIIMEPDNDTYLASACSYAIHTGEYEKGLKYGIKAININNNISWYHVMTSWIAYLSGKIDIAKKYADSALKFGQNTLGQVNYDAMLTVMNANPVTTTPTTQAAQITFEKKSNIIFDLVEKDYAQYFFPATATQVSGSGNEIQYSRIYNNEYQAALITKENHIWYGFYGELYHFGTLDEANQQLCKNKCW